MKRDWLINQRKGKGMTQVMVAEACGISRSYYTQIELGQRRPSPDIAQRLSQILGVEWTQFFL